VRGNRSRGSKVVGRLHNPPTEVVLPYAVYKHPRSQRVIGLREPASECQPVTAARTFWFWFWNFKWVVQIIQNLEDAWLNGWAGSLKITTSVEIGGWRRRGVPEGLNFLIRPLGRPELFDLLLKGRDTITGGLVQRLINFLLRDADSRPQFFDQVRLDSASLVLGRSQRRCQILTDGLRKGIEFFAE